MAESSACRPLRRDMLPQPVDVEVSGGPVDLAQATHLAKARARELHPEVMLVAWFDQKTREYSPKITC
jgi:hypothetical protein